MRIHFHLGKKNDLVYIFVSDIPDTNKHICFVENIKHSAYRIKRGFTNITSTFIGKIFTYGRADVVFIVDYVNGAWRASSVDVNQFEVPEKIMIEIWRNINEAI